MTDVATIMGLDVAFAHLGYAVRPVDDIRITAAGVLCPEDLPAKQHRKGLFKSDMDYVRYLSWYRMTHALLTKHRPIAVIMELPTGGAQNSSAMAKMAAASALMAALEVTFSDTLFLSVTPGEVKQAAVQRNTGSKAEIIAAATTFHPELRGFGIGKTLMEHACDAAMALRAGLLDDNNKRILPGVRTEPLEIDEL